MKKIVFALVGAFAFLGGLSSCSIFENDEERVPVEPTSNSSQKPWNQMQKFEENSMFKSMERRR